MPDQKTHKGIREFLGDNVIALIVSLVGALTIASLATAGIISTSLAYIFLVLAWFGCIGATYIGDPRWNVTNKHRILVALVSGFIMFVMGYFEYKHRPDTQPEPNNQRNSTVTDEDVFMECERSGQPTTYTTNGHLYLLSLWSAPNSSDALMEETPLRDGEKNIDFGPPNPLKTYYKCNIINYSPRPIFDINIDLEEKYLNTVKTDGFRTDGTVSSLSVAHIHIPSIDPGRENPFIFYITNLSDKFCQLSMPTDITLKRLSPATSETIKPIRSPVNGVIGPLPPSF